MLSSDAFVTSEDGVRLFVRSVGSGSRPVIPSASFLFDELQRLAADDRTRIFFNAITTFLDGAWPEAAQEMESVLVRPTSARIRPGFISDTGNHRQRRIFGEPGVGERPPTQVEHRPAAGDDSVGVAAVAAQAGARIAIGRVSHCGDGYDGRSRHEQTGSLRTASQLRGASA